MRKKIGKQELDTELTNEISRGGKGSASIVIAANNSSQKSKDRADFVVPDGTDNAQVTINKAINSLPSFGGKVVLVEGEYIVSGSIFLPDYVALEGMGRSTVIKIRDDQRTNFNIISNIDTSDGNVGIQIRDMVLDGVKSSNTGAIRGINFEKVRDSMVCNIVIRNMSSMGLSYNECDNNIIQNSQIHRNKDFGVYFNSSNYNTIINNHIHHNGWDCIVILYSNHNIICNNRIHDHETRSTDKGINASGNDHIIINNHLYSNGIGIDISGSNNTVDSNYIHDHASHGIFIGASYSNIQNNLIRNSGGFGIYVSFGTANFVTNNDLYQSGSKGNFLDQATGTRTTPGNRM